MLKLQREVLEKFLDSVAISKNGETKWFVLNHVLRKYATQTDVQDPEQLVRWDPEQVATASANLSGMENPQDDGFIRELVRRGLFINAEAANIMWTMMCQVMVDVLLNERRAIDLRFAILAAMPYRANWKEILWDIDGGTMEPFKSFNRQAVMDNIGEKFLDKRLTSWTIKTKTVRFSLDLIPKRTWWKLVARRERTRIVRSGDLRYYQFVDELIKFYIPLAVESYYMWLKEISTPFYAIPQVDAESNPGKGVLQKGLVYHRGHKVRTYPLSIPVWDADALIEIVGRPVRLPVTFLPEVPHFRLVIMDMRKYRYATTDWKRTFRRRLAHQKGWVSVRNVGSGKIQTQRLLVLRKDW